MNCRWDMLMNILPVWMRRETENRGRDTLREIRLRLCQRGVLLTGEGRFLLPRPVQQEDIDFCINAASRYSPWASQSVSQGYLTAPGGHRLGLCGEAVYKNGVFSGLREISAVCIRVARDFPGLAQAAPMDGSVLILGAPGWGKTTLLRDLIRQRSQRQLVAVVDQRGELFPSGFDRGKGIDVLTGAEKPDGILRLLQTMGPEVIAVDEITQPEDCVALHRSAHCGVQLLATAHAADFSEFRRRELYRPLLEEGIFDHVLILQQDRHFRTERMRP